ncbi:MULTISPECIES: hypothetical protein [unclassified Bradyrhizobium]|uniref:hypothetical protein n=1 Tax=unclassified Bradyrhizobium TaxID=2631580 RepID=UPI001BAC197B|nr:MULTISPECIES: hypothetical protein [unclassified Bradyrhizobium]MBR1313525.1 hypothetical protein [Bradyrhizobium sp. AUGA SZCCT0051]WLA52349.1 hypothetical protein QIH80_21010 [Bradyrhizobium elkanii]MBR1206986.1 hypothetical protein [Bradyrhizobium sp. AUGA SZCCT0124]MBR1343378.1 hypothetical protein [Bradyrhizobium sp. AUGA SZCCT0105]MBR1357202.1 hypothetical protein [Bradyrhizobium sp. AUGA SZCCT0045]
MITDHLSDPQFYALMAAFLGAALAALILLIARPFADRPRDAGVGFRWVKR